MDNWKKTWLRVSRFEYWPFNVLYFPVFFVFLWQMVRSRAVFFFTSANPSLDFGGMLGESKSDIYDLIPPHYLPVTQRFPSGTTADEIAGFVRAKGLRYPFILKPNIGERGWMVERINDERQLEDYLQKIRVPFLLQEFVDYPIELGVFYVRRPHEPNGRVTSIVQKGFLSVVGDGTSTVKMLLEKNSRALLTFDFDSAFYRDLLRTIPQKGEKRIIEGIGNHCRGTTFLNAAREIDEKINRVFDALSKQIPEFYFGRYDLRCASFEDLRKGENFKIVELNGAGAEPGHIYQPGYPLWKAYRDIIWHLQKLGQISRENQLRGHTSWSFRKGLQKIREIRHYNQMKAK